MHSVGLRTLELVREPDAWGESFSFVVNGVPLFAKGANWIPADALPSRLTDQRLEWLLGAADDRAAAKGRPMVTWPKGL